MDRPQTAPNSIGRPGHAIRSIAALIRPQIAVQAALYTFLGAYLGDLNQVDIGGTILVAAFFVGLTVSFGFVINDLADYDIDRLTKPERPLVAGRISLQYARVVGWALVLLILCGTFVLPPILATLLTINLCLTAFYSLVLKRTVLLGNICIAYLNASILLFGAIAGGTPSPLVWLVAAMSCCYSLAQEILYTVDDRSGDAAAGIVTTAIYMGNARSLALVRIFLVLSVMLAVAPWMLGLTSHLYLFALIICTLIPIGVWILPYIRNDEPARIRAACVTVKRVRLSSLLPLLLIAVPW